jgi:hypothetical protein
MTPASAHMPGPVCDQHAPLERTVTGYGAALHMVGYVPIPAVNGCR